MKNILIIATLFAMALPAFGATQITVSCSAPTTRVGGAILLPTEIKDYSFWYQQPALTEQGPSIQPTCNYTVNIAQGTCIKAGTMFSGAATDTDGTLGLRGIATLGSDACNPKPQIVAPVVTITVK